MYLNKDYLDRIDITPFVRSRQFEHGNNVAILSRKIGYPLLDLKKKKQTKTKKKI